MSRKRFISSLLIHCLSMSMVLGAGASVARAADHPLKGKKVEMAILGIGGWLPSRLGVDMSPIFAKYAKEKYGYDVSFTFAEAPFSALFQKAASTLATRSQEYNIIISDSQWLGAFAEPRWIVKISDLIKQHPEFDLQWYDPVSRETYQVYPDGSNELWGLPEEGDVVALFVRKDLFNDAGEQAAFKAKYGMPLPQTFEDWERSPSPSSRRSPSSSPGRRRTSTAPSPSTPRNTTSCRCTSIPSCSRWAGTSGIPRRQGLRHPQQRRERQGHGMEQAHAEVPALPAPPTTASPRTSTPSPRARSRRPSSGRPSASR